MNLRASGSRITMHVYSAGSKWVWIVQEFGSTLVSGTAPDKATAKERAREARLEIASVTPGGLVNCSKYPGRRVGK